MSDGNVKDNYQKDQEVGALHSPIDFSQTWDNCSLEEKIERLRRTLHDYRYSQNEITRRYHQFEEHQHDAVGDIVVPLRSRFGDSSVQASSFDFLR